MNDQHETDLTVSYGFFVFDAAALRDFPPCEVEFCFDESIREQVINICRDIGVPGISVLINGPDGSICTCSCLAYASLDSEDVLPSDKGWHAKSFVRNKRGLVIERGLFVSDTAGFTNHPECDLDFCNLEEVQSAVREVCLQGDLNRVFLRKPDGTVCFCRCR